MTLFRRQLKVSEVASEALSNSLSSKNCCQQSPKVYASFGQRGYDLKSMPGQYAMTITFIVN